jgi:acyl-CoA reductase-like NAD-dependent aldehyde dehydrogenase
MNLRTEEAFGPLVGYRQFLDEGEAVKLANSLGYRLSASVFTRDLRTGKKARVGVWLRNPD